MGDNEQETTKKESEESRVVLTLREYQPLGESKPNKAGVISGLTKWKDQEVLLFAKRAR